MRRLVIAAASNGGGYANLLRANDSTGILETVLAELWDFDTRISTDGQQPPNPAPQDYLQANGQRMRAYTQTPTRYNTGHPQDEAFFVADLRDSAGSWANYYPPNPPQPATPEKPRLPPGPYNSTGLTDSPDHGLDYTHHLIRDFMFLDAAAHNSTANLPAPFAPPANNYPYHVARVKIPPDVNDDPNLTQFTQGTRHHTTNKYLLDDTVSPGSGTRLQFEVREVGFTALLYELRDDAEQPATDTPNWFGVAVPDDIADYRNVVLYFHPNPSQPGAGYSPNDYPTKSGKSGTNWKELFAYVDRLGNQLAGAAKFAGADGDPRNQIVVFPFMKAYREIDKLGDYWYFIIRDILADIVTNGVSGGP